MQTTSSSSHYDQTVNIIRTALPRMSEFRIPITPENYAVWFEYFENRNQALRQELDNLLASKKGVSEAEIKDLYERHLRQREEQLGPARQALPQMLQALRDHVSQSDGNFSQLSRALEEFVEKLGTEVSSEQLSVLVGRALESTSVALERGTMLQGQISSLAKEVEVLQGEIERTAALSRLDPLTKLNNRLAFQESVEALAIQAPTDVHAPCLMMIDVDHFKKVNDSHGHVVGDLVLKEVAQVLARNVRGKDLLARYGGEEFAVLLRDTPRSGCYTVSNNILAAVENSRVRIPEAFAKAAPELAVTVSIGVAWYREGESTESFVDRADRALYLSKKTGRNRVTWESRVTSPTSVGA